MPDQNRQTEALTLWLATFARDREFCDALVSTQASGIARLLVYVSWCHQYFSAIQEELVTMAKMHFPSAHVDDATGWTLTVTGGVYADICLVPYLVARGVIREAGLAIRRGMENVGVLTQLWREPEKAGCLTEPDAPEFRRAFVWEADKARSALLRAGGVQKRFELCLMAKPLSDLYQLYSRFGIHGGSYDQFVGVEVMPTRFSDMLVHRPDPYRKDLGSDLQLLGMGCEMLLIELCYVHGSFGNRYGVTPSRGGEGHFFLTQLLESGPDGGMSQLIAEALQAFGWANDGERASHRG